jgi:hypothetical protein
MYAFVISGGRSTHAALFHYRNSNQKWVETGTVPNPHSLHSVVVCDDFLWIGSSKGILHYSVKQASWDFFPSGLHAQSITGLAGKSIGVFATSSHGQFFQYNEIRQCPHFIDCKYGNTTDTQASKLN